MQEEEEVLRNVERKDSAKRVAVAYKNTFDTPSGKLVLKDLLGRCGVDRDLHVAADPTSTAFNVGRYSVWQYIRARLNADDIEITKELKVKS